MITNGVAMRKGTVYTLLVKVQAGGTTMMEIGGEVPQKSRTVSTSCPALTLLVIFSKRLDI